MRPVGPRSRTAIAPRSRCMHALLPGTHRVGASAACAAVRHRVPRCASTSGGSVPVAADAPTNRSTTRSPLRVERAVGSHRSRCARRRDRLAAAAHPPALDRRRARATSCVPCWSSSSWSTSARSPRTSSAGCVGGARCRRVSVHAGAVRLRLRRARARRDVGVSCSASRPSRSPPYATDLWPALEEFMRRSRSCRRSTRSPPSSCACAARARITAGCASRGAACRPPRTAPTNRSTTRSTTTSRGVE